MWSAEDRGKAMGVYTLGPILGPVIGPIAGGFIAQYSTWRWVFWATSAAAVVVQVTGFIWLRECHPATLLRKRCDVLIQKTGNTKLHTGEKVETLAYRLLHAFERPMFLFTTQPIVFCMAIYMAYLFGVTYLMLATFPDIWTEIYQESSSIGGLNYISIAIGSFGPLHEMRSGSLFASALREGSVRVVGLAASRSVVSWEPSSESFELLLLILGWLLDILR